MSLSLVWVMWAMAVLARRSSTLCVSLLRLAKSASTAPNVVLRQLFSLRLRISPPMSAARARMVTLSGAPVCSTSSTTKLPLSTSSWPTQPMCSSISASLRGSSSRPSWSLSSRSSWSAVFSRPSVRVRLIRRASTKGVMSLPATVSA